MHSPVSVCLSQHTDPSPSQQNQCCQTILTIISDISFSKQARLFSKYTLVLSQKLHWYYFNLVSLHCCSFISYIIHSFAHTKLRHHILTICSRLTLFKVGLIWGAGWAVFSPFALPSLSAHTTACP